MEEKGPKTISEFAEYYKARHFNNFYVRFPGSLYRSRTVDPSEKKLQDDLDCEASRLGIDAKAIFEEMIQGNNKVSEAIAVMQNLGGDSDTPEVKILTDEGEAIRQVAHKKMIPLFDALVALGYHPNRLVR